MVHSTDIVEFELRSKKFTLAVRKKEALVQPEPMYLPVQVMLLLHMTCTWVGAHMAYMLKQTYMSVSKSKCILIGQQLIV